MRWSQGEVHRFLTSSVGWSFVSCQHGNTRGPSVEERGAVVLWASREVDGDLCLDWSDLL